MLRDNASILDIYVAGQQVLSFSKGLTQAELKMDPMRTSAVLYQVLIIGEATKRLSREFRDEHPEIPWDDMAGMRDVVAHEYDRIDFDLLWQVIQRSIPGLLGQIEPFLSQEPSE